MTTKDNSKGFAKAKPFVKETIEWNKIATIVATIMVLFFFTRSAPFPSTTFWELRIAKDFIDNYTVLYPEIITYKIEDSSLSFIGLKAVYHILYFIICSLLSIWVFKNKEPLPGLIGLSVFVFSMQTFLNLRLLLTILFIICILFLFEHRSAINRIEIIFIPIMAAASSLGLNTILLLSLIICYSFFVKNNSLSIVYCSIIGGLFFPEGFVAFLDTDSVFNINFIPDAEIKILYVLSAIFLFFNLISIGKSSKENLPIIVYYALTGFFALLWPTTIPIFITVGLFVLIKLYSDQQPLSLIYQMFGLLLITTMVYLYLFVNPYGIKLNPSIKNQIKKELIPIEEGYYDKKEIERHNLGELAWNSILKEYDLNRLLYYFKKEKIILIRTNGIYDIKEPDQLIDRHKEIDF